VSKVNVCVCVCVCVCAASGCKGGEMYGTCVCECAREFAGVTKRERER
jgi:hypothetical protein